jgi:hypothetical protein
MLMRSANPSFTFSLYSDFSASATHTIPDHPFRENEDDVVDVVDVVVVVVVVVDVRTAY